MPLPSVSAVSEAGVPAGGEDAGEPGEEDAAAEGDGEADGVGAEGVEEVEGADGDRDGDALGCAEPPEACPRTRWPAAIGAEPVITSVREPTGGGAGARTGAACPLTAPRVRWARVAEADT